jgi:hypothetical protein
MFDAAKDQSVVGAFLRLLEEMNKHYEDSASVWHCLDWIAIKLATFPNIVAFGPPTVGDEIRIPVHVTGAHQWTL